MASSTPFDDGLYVEDDHWHRTHSLFPPTSDGDLGFGNGIFENFSSQRSRSLNGRTGGSSSHGDGPHGDELRGSEISDEAVSVLGEKNTVEQDELGLLPADFDTPDHRQEPLQGEDKLTDAVSGPLASDQASSSSGGRGNESDVTKKSATDDKSYVPSSGCGSPKPRGKRKLVNSMRGLSQMNTRSRARLEDPRNDNPAPTPPTQAEPVRAGGTGGSKKRKQAASQKRVAKMPFGSDETGLEPDTLHKKSSMKLGSQAKGSSSESPSNPSSASSNRQQHAACKNASSNTATGKVPDMSIYDVEGSSEPEKPAPRKTAAKGRSKKRTATAPAPAPTTTGQKQPAKKSSSRKPHASAGSKSQAKSQGKKQMKPLKTYGRPLAAELVGESSPEKTTIPNSKRRRTQADKEATDRPFKRLKAVDDAKASPDQNEQVSSTPRKVSIVTSDDADDGDGVAENENTFNLRANPNLPHPHCHAVSPAVPQDESTQRQKTHEEVQWAFAEAPLSKTTVTSGQTRNNAPRSTAGSGDMRAHLPLQVVSQFPKSHHHSAATDVKPTVTVSEREIFPRIGQGIRDLHRSNHFGPLSLGQNDQRLGVLPTSTAAQQDDRQSSPYSLHPRSMAFQQKLSSMQTAREKEQPRSKETSRMQPQAVTDQHSSRGEVQDGRPLKGKDRWQAAVDETSQGLADTMHSITNVGLLQLTRVYSCH